MSTKWFQTTVKPKTRESIGLTTNFFFCPTFQRSNSSSKIPVFVCRMRTHKRKKEEKLLQVVNWPKFKMRSASCGRFYRVSDWTQTFRYPTHRVWPKRPKMLLFNAQHSQNGEVLQENSSTEFRYLQHQSWEFSFWIRWNVCLFYLSIHLSLGFHAM